MPAQAGTQLMHGVLVFRLRGNDEKGSLRLKSKKYSNVSVGVDAFGE
jgi:hypothetical protein